jgi:hypothetical protein
MDDNDSNVDERMFRMTQYHVVHACQRYRVIVTLEHYGCSWQASYLSDSLPDGEAIMALASVWFVEIFDRQTNTFVE